MPQSQVISCRIDRPLSVVAEFLADPLNMNHWAAGMGHSLRQDGGGWQAQGPDGPLCIRFSPPNAFGIADHWVTLPGRNGAADTVVYVPLRVIAHEASDAHGTEKSGTEKSVSEVQFTLLPLPGMSDADFARDAALVRRDLETLKAFLEKP